MESHHRTSPEIRQRARELRHEQTPAERRLWQILRGRSLGGYKFRRQHPIDSYIIDFYCPKAKLCIEVDGDQHSLPPAEESDSARTEYLESLGCRVMRFSNVQVMNALEDVVRAIIKELERQIDA
jgi:very-short-patch-repair endonuclease